MLPRLSNSPWPIATLVLFAISPWSIAAQPSMLSKELSATKSICNATVSKSLAEYQLAEWKLSQLEQLRDRQHATWQELAEQQRIVCTLKAHHEAAVEHADYVTLICASTLQREVPQGDEADSRVDANADSVCLNLPHSTRVVGWISVRDASRKLLQRQLETLESHIAEIAKANVTELDAELQRAVNRLALLQGRKSRTQREESRLDRARVQVRLADANKKLAQATEAFRSVLEQRLGNIQHEINNREMQDEDLLAVQGTPFVTSANNAALADLSRQIVDSETGDRSELVWLQQLEKMKLERVDALRRLRHRTPSLSPATDTVTKELQAGEQELVELQSAIQKKQLEVAGTENLNGAASNEKSFPNFSKLRDLSAIRHGIELHRQYTALKAARTTALADAEYRQERLARISSVPSPRHQEVKLARLRSELALSEIEVIEAKRATLNLEAHRFLAQRRAQRAGRYEFVQANGKFIPRATIERQQMLLATIGMVGGAMKTPASGYLESQAVAKLLGKTTGAAGRVWHSASHLSNSGETGIGRRGYGFVSQRYRSGTGRTAALGRSLGYSYSAFAPPSLDRSSFYDGVNSPGVVTQFRSRIPRYSDFYSLRVRRYDGPAGTSFQRGRRAYSPFYLPGSPTNFRY